MTIAKDNGKIVFLCDECEEFIETRKYDFSEAWAHAVEQGWVARKLDNKWVHYCPDCKGDLG